MTTRRRNPGNSGYVVDGSHFIRDGAFARRMARKWADEGGRSVKVQRFDGERTGKVVYTAKPAYKRNASKRSVRKRVAAALKKYVRGNPAPVKGRKVKGGRAVTVKNFTGTIVKKADGTVQIVGRGRK